MATLYGVNATKRDVNVPADKIGKGEVAGRLRVAYDEYVAAGAITSGDIIKMMKLPPKARVLDVIFSSSDLGTTGTAVVGWAANGVDNADTDGFLTTIDLNAAAINASMAATAVPPAGQFKQFSVETQVQVELTASTTAAGTIKLAVLFVVD